MKILKNKKTKISNVQDLIKNTKQTKIQETNIKITPLKLV